MHSTLASPRPVVGRGRRLLESARQHVAEGRPLQAAKAYAGVLEEDPGCVEAHGQLGSLFFQFKRYTESHACLQKAVRLAPRMPKVNLLMGAVLREMGRLEESAACCQREIQLSPSDAHAHYNLGLVLQSLKRPAEAVEAFKHAINLCPGYVDAIMGEGMALRQAGDHEAAMDSFERVIDLEPDNVVARFELSTILLSLGQFERGWKEYEWRRKLKDHPTRPVTFEQAPWDGKHLGGRRILLECEQGFGDVIQFSRYASLVANRDAEVILGCPESLRPVMQTLRGVSEVVTSRHNLPHFDTYASLLSLPLIFGTVLETIPREIPYLRAPPRNFSSPRWVNQSPGLKVGLVWSGNQANRAGRYRSVRLDFFGPLLRFPGICWYSLQVGGAADELAMPAFAGRITDLGRRFASFGDTAQAIAELDLVIAVDTSVAHLAGALGKPVWILLPFDADWRWMIGRQDSPWYPTMKLFRQPKPGDWAEVRAQIEVALCDFAHPTRHC
ncbi:MAG: tetratricopeptide repeat protein [Limisphaerales bacterium]